MSLARAAGAVVLALMLAGARPPMRYAPDPSAIVAAEIAFNRLAQQKGQWTAFRTTAAKDAVMFVPQPVSAQAWLKGRKDPPAAVRWQPHRVFLSCDGGTGVSTGAWQRPDGSTGYFTTIWQRQKDGAWKWVLDHGDTLSAPREPGEMIAGRVARCPKGPPPAPPVTAVAPTPGAGQSADGSLRWSWAVAADTSRRLVVMLRDGDREEAVLTDEVAAPQS